MWDQTVVPRLIDRKPLAVNYKTIYFPTSFLFSVMVVVAKSSAAVGASPIMATRRDKRERDGFRCCGISSKLYNYRRE